MLAGSHSPLLLAVFLGACLNTEKDTLVADTSSDECRGSTEVCDGVDNDCDGEEDEEVKTTFFRDNDGDGYGDPAAPLSACAPPDGYVSDNTDCDDNSRAVFPGAPESCNGADDDCDGTEDEEAWDAPLWYLDHDSDGYGGTDSVRSCDTPAGALATSTDCDDGNVGSFPGANETCDGIDNDCDGSVDENVTSPFYADDDGDGYGDASARLYACEAPPGFVSDPLDCDDVAHETHPGAIESCDGDDDNCNAEIDEAIDGCATANLSPTISILLPVDGSKAIVGDSISFSAITWDDGSTSPVLTWSSDTDGIFGESLVDPGYSSGSWEYPSLTLDVHIITATITDDIGLEATDTVVIDIVAETERPTIVSEHPSSDESSTEGNPYRFQARVSDSTDGPTMLRVTFASDREGVFCDINADEEGVAACEAALGPGVHVLTFTVTDTDNLSATSSTEFRVDWVDNDEDGFTEADGDLDDASKEVWPGAPEKCDGIDNDGDGDIDEDPSEAPEWFADYDSDGFGAPDSVAVECSAPTGMVDNGLDCDDTDASVNPGAVEFCGAPDLNCDGLSPVTPTWYMDWDSDGWGDIGLAVTSCAGPVGWVIEGGDCDDSNPSANPLGIEICNGIDDDCDGVAETGAVDASLWYGDADGDSHGDPATHILACEAPYGFVANPDDCNDAEPAAWVGATETCDDGNIDEDCDGYADDADPDATDKVDWFYDGDGDGFGLTTRLRTTCDKPTSYTAFSGDCDDANLAINPAATEVCDDADIDEDCDGGAEEADPEGATRSPSLYTDADGDGFGDVSRPVCDAGIGKVADATDCDDADPRARPGAVETCDSGGRDEDCDGLDDDDDPGGATGKRYWYYDKDSDGWGSLAESYLACSAPSGWVPSTGDCNDDDDRVWPGATEVCDEIDNDCNGITDEGAPTWHLDADGDGFGSEEVVRSACSPPAGYLEDGGDCDDDDPSISPTSVEICDGLDNNCDGEADEGVAPIWHSDADGDGYGSATVTWVGCTMPSGWIADGADCDDARSDVRPGVEDPCDLIDNDCDDAIDEDPPAWYADGDGDGFGDSTTTISACAVSAGYVEDSTDCNDHDDTVWPEAPETCDGSDNDCDGFIDEDPPIWYYDADGDGFGIDAGVMVTCFESSGWVLEPGDCDDNDAAVNPSAEEVCGNGIDENCGGLVWDCGLYGDVSASNAEARLIGEYYNYFAGVTVAAAGDMDGDGLSDFLVGAQYGTEAVYVVGGPITGTIELAEIESRLYAKETTRHADQALSTGDIDGDGWRDILVGTPTSGYDVGDIFIILGPITGPTSLDSGDIYNSGVKVYEEFGASVSLEFDFNEDGLADPLVGSPGYYEGNDKGAVYIYDGSRHEWSYSYDTRLVGDSGDRSGDSVFGADVNGDGTTDLLIGAPGYSESTGASMGAVYVVLGPVDTDKFLTEADALLTGEGAGDQAGDFIVCAGDSDGNGLDDLLVGAPYSDGNGESSGVAYLVLSPILGERSFSLSDAIMHGEASGDYAGYSLASAGDVDGDNRSELLIGAPKRDEKEENTGIVYMVPSPVYGTFDLAMATARIMGDAKSDEFGISVAGGQDVDGDDIPDTVIGAHQVDNGIYYNAGMVGLFLGGTGT